jgi:hypothetical protein
MRPIVLVAVAVLAPLLLGFVIRVPGLRIGSLSRTLLVVAIAATAIVIVFRRARIRLIDWLRAPEACFTIITAFAAVMSFGPAIHARGRVVLEPSLYTLFYRFVPGYDGLRVPARFAMIAALGLAVLCGLALAHIGRRWLAVLAATLIVAEVFGPVALNQNSPNYARAGLNPLPLLERTAPPVYEFLAQLPQRAVVLELPLGEPAFDVRYQFFSTTHWRRLVNGYSGGSPSDYERLDEALQDALIRPDRAAAAVRTLAAPTHIVVHEAYYAGDRGAGISAWVRRLGGVELATFNRDRVFAMP